MPFTKQISNPYNLSFPITMNIAIFQKNEQLLKFFSQDSGKNI